VDWGHEKAIEMVSLAGMIHNIGKVNLPQNIVTLEEEEMDEYDIKQYKTHCALGAEILAPISIINDQIRLMVMQHHERINGSGYPKGLIGLRVFPMAQVLGLADEISQTVLKYNISSKDSFKLLLQDTDFLESFEPEIIKAMSTIFVKEKRKKKNKKNISAGSKVKMRPSDIKRTKPFLSSYFFGAIEIPSLAIMIFFIRYNIPIALLNVFLLIPSSDLISSGELLSFK
jgi:HD-GYP domain-containing protein (c-di-GMP phosphodiesterase class II)